ncbi:MAG TPA: hypothetical protein ENN06_10955 [Desulfobacteraceae bacterium]|nr:hypothetical protein [Desulfobacteraceae bacterium]
MHSLLQRAAPTIVLVLTILLMTPKPGPAETDIVTLTLPETTIRQFLQNMLPLPIEAGNDHLQGDLVLDSISRLEMRENAVHVQGLVVGSNVALQTRMGDQLLNMKVGEVRQPLTCDFSFRFDPVGKILYVTPRLEPPAPTDNPQADAILPFLVMLGDREYPVDLAAVRTFQTRIGGQDVAVFMDPVDIEVMPRQLIVKMKPIVSKSN